MYNKLIHLIESKQKTIVITFFALFLVLSLSVLKDYGLNWDEEMQWKQNGEVAATYIVKHDQTARHDLIKSTEKYHGPAFEIVLIFFQKAFQLKDTRDVYLMRHLITFLSFFIGVVFFYFLCKLVLKSWKLALIGCIFLVLSPRIFGDSFHNTKDIPFLSFFIISMYALLRFHAQPGYKNAAVYAMVSAFAIDIRILGIMLPALSFLFFGIDSFYAQFYKKKERFYVKKFLFYIICLITFTILFWPILWEGPVHHFLMAFKEMSQFPWNNKVLYQEIFIKTTELPWHYLPVWISITTPIPYLLFFLMGLVFIIQQIFTNPINFIFYKREQQLLLLSFFLPLLTIIILKSVVYDGWRHVFYIYPAFLVIALYGLIFMYKFFKRKKEILVLFLTLIIGTNLVITLQLHPHEYVYFNALAGRNMKEVKEQYELDYYGVSSKEALEFILKNDTSSTIKIYPERYPSYLNTLLLPKEQRDRIQMAGFYEATYFIGQYRYRYEEYDLENKLFSVMVGNASIMSVFKLTDTDRRKGIPTSCLPEYQ